jgi:hypothetical protein
VALRLHAILGGTSGYRDLLGLASPREVRGIGSWLAGARGRRDVELVELQRLYTGE